MEQVHAKVIPLWSTWGRALGLATALENTAWKTTEVLLQKIHHAYISKSSDSKYVQAM